MCGYRNICRAAVEAVLAERLGIYVLISISEKSSKRKFHYYPLRNLKVDCIMELGTQKKKIGDVEMK